MPIGIMVFTRYKKFGNKEYAYEVTSYWDSMQKKPRQKSTYLGMVINKKKKIYEKKQPRIIHEQFILDFGDIYLLDNFLKQSGFIKILKSVFAEHTPFLTALISYRLCYGSAMYFAQTWFEGSYTKIIYKENLSSQRISDFLKILGKEDVLRKFFKIYLQDKVANIKGIILDATSLPNQIHMPLTEWGINREEIDKQIRFLLVVDKTNSQPLFFRILPGNIVDVSVLSNTISELEKLGLKDLYTYLDAGFFSEANLKELYEKNINFLTRLPASRLIYKELIKTEIKNLEAIPNGVRYGKRILFIKQKKINLFGKEIYAHIVLDPKRKAREINNYLLEIIDEKDENTEAEYTFAKKGIMILISSFQISKEEVVPAYYIRQTVEKLFGFSKDDLNILPLRGHSEETVRGFIFLQFLSLIAFTQLKNKLGNKATVEEILFTMRNLKCKVYENEILISELSKKQRLIAESLNIMVPKKLGI